MDLIIGGAYQGKLTWAAEHYTIRDAWDLAKGLPDGPRDCLYHLEALTFAAAQQGKTAQAVLEALLPLTEKAVVIAREVGSGVVPMDKTERLWRELHGSVLKALAGRANHVTRIFCGLAEVLK